MNPDLGGSRCHYFQQAPCNSNFTNQQLPADHQTFGCNLIGTSACFCIFCSAGVLSRCSGGRHSSLLDSTGEDKSDSHPETED